MSNNLTKTHTHTERDIYIIIIIFGVPRPIHCGTPSLLHPLGRFGGFSRRAPPRPHKAATTPPIRSPQTTLVPTPPPSLFPATAATPHAPSCCRHRRPPAPPDRLHRPPLNRCADVNLRRLQIDFVCTMSRMSAVGGIRKFE
jgi:hypothetical protein